eukprot:Clim_evm65s232 gene=Clim_evmTU65s232
MAQGKSKVLKQQKKKSVSASALTRQKQRDRLTKSMGTKTTTSLSTKTGKNLQKLHSKSVEEQVLGRSGFKASQLSALRSAAKSLAAKNKTPKKKGKK